MFSPAVAASTTGRVEVVDGCDAGACNRALARDQCTDGRADSRVSGADWSLSRMAKSKVLVEW